MRQAPSNSKTALIAALAVAVAATTLLVPSEAHATTPAEAWQKGLCMSCHSVGAGKLVGPDLKGITEKRSEEWLLKFIKSPKAMIDSGDKVAVALFEEFKVMMPDPPLTDAEIKLALEFTKGAAGEAPAPAPTVSATPEQIALGEQLFQGHVALSGGGPTCVSCHDVTSDAIISGGILAKELTTVFTRLGGAGVRAVMGSPPFPVMQAAYQDKPLTEDEMTALVGFLQKVSADQEHHMPRDTGLWLAGSGVVGVIVLLFLFHLLWGRRKRGSVNQAIYDRQVKSS